MPNPILKYQPAGGLTRSSGPVITAESGNGDGGTPILGYQPGGGPTTGSSTIGQRNGYLYYWPDIENLTGSIPQTDLEAQDISVLPSESLIIVVTGVDGDETHWRRMPDASSPVTDLGLGIIVPINYDSETRPWVLLQELTGGGDPHINAFGTIAVGATNIVADSAPDTLTLIAGTNITLTPDALADSIMIAASGSGTSMSSAVAQTAHGFVVGDVLRYTGTAYAKAKADTAANAEVVGLVGGVADSNNFTLMTGGVVTGLSGLTAGSVYFLSTTTAGLLTTTAPGALNHVSKPLLVATSATGGYFFNWRGWVVGSAVAQGGGAGSASASQSAITSLVNGQAYIDVTFDIEQTDADWVFLACSVLNTVDPTPLNIWPGIITSKTSTGFRLQLNGMPDSNNYYLHWAVSGVNIPPPAPFPATTYTLTGPTTGVISTASTAFTVKLPIGGTVAVPVTVTPHDGGGGGTFTPATVTLTTVAPVATFTYTPASYGAKTISVTNDFGLADPGNLTYSVFATTYTLSGPSTGAPSAASTNFTVALPVGGVVTGTVTVTPHDGGGGGTFTPTTVGLTTGAPSATFTYTPTATLGARTISVTNNGGLTNPGNLTYTVAVLPLSDGDPVSTWSDSSVNGNDATQTGSARPVYKTAILNAKPVLRFTATAFSGLHLTSTISGAGNFTVFNVMKPTSTGGTVIGLAGSGGTSPDALYLSGGVFAIGNNGAIGYTTGVVDTVFHVYSGNIDTGSTPNLYVDGAIQGFSGTAGGGTGINLIGYRSSDSTYSTGDIAEIIIYNSILGATDRQNIEKYLGTKYAISVVGGSAVQPDTVTGLIGWWKADSL